MADSIIIDFKEKTVSKIAFARTRGGGTGGMI